MRSFKSHPWKLSYKTSGLHPVDILHDFYIPALSRAVRYDRVAGYFRSSSLAAASQGFSAFLGRNGRMRLIAGADLAAEDVEAVLRGEADRLTAHLSRQLGEPNQPRTEAETRGVALLASLVQQEVLEVKVALRVSVETGKALPFDSIEDGYVHMKWAVFTDSDGQRLYVSGSLNESKTALKLNAENIDVHCDWKSEEGCQRADEAEAEFETLWNDGHPAFRVLPIPDAIPEQLIRFTGPLPTPPLEIDGTSAAPLAIKPSPEEWLSFAFLKDAPRLPGGLYLGLETAPVEPWPHQRIVARRLVDSWPLSWMMCDEVGLGKTIETGLALRCLYLSGFIQRVLIAAPASVVPQWQREMADKVKSHSQQRTAVGFMLSFFSLRFASSYKAILDTLKRRHAKLTAVLEQRSTPAEPSEDEWEDLVDSESDEPDDAIASAGLLHRSATDLRWESGKLAALIERLVPLAMQQSPKVRALLTVLQQRALPSGRIKPLVVFTRFYDTLLDIQSWIERSGSSVRLGVFAGPRCAFVDPAALTWVGSNREEVKRRFVSGDIDVLLCTDAAAEGLNLQTADLLVNFDLPWNPMKVEQRIGRIDRIGQKHSIIHVANLAYPGTVEEEVYVRLQQRIAGAAGVVGAQQVIVLSVLSSDLRKLATGEMTRDELDAVVTQRLDQAAERAEAMELTPDELYSLYQRLDDELENHPVPVSLSQLFSILEESPFLKALGCERIETEYGGALAVKGIPGQEAFALTVSRELFEHGLRGRPEPLHFASWGDPAFDSLLDFVLSSADAPTGVRKIEVPVVGTRTALVGWETATDTGPRVLTRFDQLRAARPSTPLAGDPAGADEPMRAARELEGRLERLRRVEAAADRSAATHQRTHRLLAASLLSLAPKTSSLADMNGLLPDGSRLLKSGKLSPEEVQAEQVLGLLRTEQWAIFIPRFYQPFLINTLKRERLALKKARKGVPDEQIRVTELVERLSRPAST